METRKRARIVKEMEAEIGRERDRKGKAVAKEEKMEEIDEIHNHSEEEEDRKNNSRRDKGRSRSEEK